MKISSLKVIFDKEIAAVLLVVIAVALFVIGYICHWTIYNAFLFTALALLVCGICLYVAAMKRRGKY